MREVFVGETIGGRRAVLGEEEKLIELTERTD
jgi:hypothetical protein